MRSFSKSSRLGLLAAVLAVGIISAALFVWRAGRPAHQAVHEPEEVIPPERRHDYLDVRVVTGLSYRYPGRGWDIQVGAVEIRRRSLGFIRIGAFNEALITDMHITLTPEFKASEVIALLRSLSDAPAPEEGNEMPSGRRPQQIGFFLEELGVRSPHADKRVSSVRIRNLSLRFAPGNGEPEVDYLSAASARIRDGYLRLGGPVQIGSPTGQQIRCREARLSLQESPVLSLREAVIHAQGITQSLDRLAFPLSALLSDEDLLSYAD